MTTAVHTSIRGRAPRLGPGYPHLLVHTRAEQLPLAAPICATEGLGTVVCVSPRAGRGRISELARMHHKMGANVSSMMFDANVYSGRNRAIGAASLNAAWVRAQTNSGIDHPLTSSGYIPEGSNTELRKVLRATAGMGEHVVAALPLAAKWLTKDAGRLIEEVNAAGVPVAAMVEHSDDPFGARETVRGLIRLIGEAHVPVLLLRSDLSVIGALAWGAAAGAFGTATSLRHIYPIKKSGGGRPASVAAVVKDALSMVRLERIDDAVHRAPDPMWSCQCTTCFGRSLNWIATENEAFQHSLSTVAGLASQVLDDRLSPTDRKRLWKSLCTNAQFRCMDISRITKTEWHEPRFLGAWVAQVTHDRADR